MRIPPTPGAVAAVLKEGAASEGQSLSAYVGAPLTAPVERPINAEIVVRLRSRSRTPGAAPGADRRSAQREPTAILVEASAMIKALVGATPDEQLLALLTAAPGRGRGGLAQATAGVVTVPAGHLAHLGQDQPLLLLGRLRVCDGVLPGDLGPRLRQQLTPRTPHCADHPDFAGSTYVRHRASSAGILRESRRPVDSLVRVCL